MKTWWSWSKEAFAWMCAAKEFNSYTVAILRFQFLQTQHTLSRVLNKSTILGLRLL